MNGNSSKGKVPFAYFHSINVKGNWAHLAEIYSQPGAKITAAFRIS